MVIGTEVISNTDSSGNLVSKKRKPAEGSAALWGKGLKKDGRPED